MSVILFIDKNPEIMSKQIESVKGIVSEGAQTIESASERIQATQFDFIFCDEQYYYDQNFLSLCKKYQPMCKVVYLVDEKNQDFIDLLQRTNNHFVKRPAKQEDITNHTGVDLLDQSDIDSLFK